MKSAETQQAALGAQLTTATVEANLAGTTEGAVAQQSQQGQASGSTAGTASATGVANTVNDSQSAGATGSAGASGGSTTASQPTRDPLASATGQESRTSTAKVVIIVKIP
jgi:hypothetical protein